MMIEATKAASWGWQAIKAVSSSVEFHETGMFGTADVLEDIAYMNAKISARHGALALLRIEHEKEMEADILAGVARDEPEEFMSSEGVERSTSGVFVGKLR